MKKYYLVCFVFLLSSFLRMQAQVLKADSVYDPITEMRVPIDTLDIRYNFVKGDTLIYRAEAHDSIIRGFESPLLRIRYEKWMLTCDSVSKKGNFHLTQELLEYVALESKGEIENVKRESSNWINRKAHLVIDSTGKRVASYPDDSLKAAIAPGSVFNPPLVEDLKERKALTYQSWSLTKQLVDWNENAVPAPLVNQTCLYKMKPKKDTLGFNCYRIEFIKTGQGSFELEAENIFLDVTTVLTGFNDYFMSLEHRIPVWANNKLEHKIRMQSGRDSEVVPGWHFIDVKYTLESLKRKGKEYLIDLSK